MGSGILAPSIAADVIDQHTLDCGEQRGARLVALWEMTDKCAIAAAAGQMKALNTPRLEPE